MRRALFMVAAAVVAVVAAFAPAMAGGRARAKAARSATTAWRVQPSPNYGGSRTTGNELDGVAATSAKNAWAVGYYYRNATDNDKTLIEHWNGRAWKVQPSRTPCRHSRLTGVAATSAKNAWAVGSCGGSLIEHWNGRAWNVVPNPGGHGANHLYGVAATSRTNAWAVGQTFKQHTGASRTVIAHFNGKVWKVVPSPNLGGPGAFALSGVAASSRTDAWAVGGGATSVLHWDGRAWKVQPGAQPRRNSYAGLGEVAATSSASAWAVGFRETLSSAEYTWIQRWNGKAWKVEPSPTPRHGGQLYGVAATSAQSAWAVGSYVDGKVTERTLIEHWNGNG